MHMSVLYEPKGLPGIMSLFPKPCSGVGDGALHGSRKDKEAPKSSRRRKINSDWSRTVGCKCSCSPLQFSSLFGMVTGKKNQRGTVKGYLNKSRY